MVDKKQLFYGVTQDFLDEQERRQRLRVQEEKRLEQLRAQKAEIEAKAEEKKRKDDERKVAYFNYINFRPTDERREKRSLKDILIGSGVFLGMWAIVSLFGNGVDDERLFNSYEKSKRSTELPTRQRLRDAFWPISNGWYVERTGDYVMGGQVIEGDYIYRYSKDAKGKFLPRGVWWVNMAFLLTGICIVIGQMNKNRKENKAVRERNKAGKAYNNIAMECVDMMMDLKELGRKLNLNDMDIEAIVEKVPDIISKMAESERIYFDMLMNGEIDVQNNKSFYDMAVAIMEGHLKKHPEEFAQILQKFDERTIPQSLMNKYGNGRS